MKFLLSIVFLLSLSACGAEDEVLALKSNLNEEKIWVFAQFNVREETDGLESYYYYAKISKDLYHQISKNKLNKGFILLEEVKYWGDEDLIYSYADGENSGELLFRIEDLTKVDLVNVEPQVGKGIEQFELEEGPEVVDETISADKLIK